ncbi:MAG: transglutaminase family protein [Acidimicrobiales bacterium]
MSFGARSVARLKQVNAPQAPEHSIPLRLAVAGAVMAAVGGVTATGVAGGQLPLIAWLGVPAGHLLSYLGRHRPGYARKALLALAATAAFARFLAVAASGVTGSAQLRVPLGELFLWIQILHSFDLPSRRDLMFTLLSSLSLMLVGGVLSDGPAFGLALAVWSLCALGALVLSHRREQAQHPALARAGPVGGWLATAGPALGAVVLVALWTTVTFRTIPPAGPAQSGLLGSRLGQSLPVDEAGGLSNPGLGGGGGSGYFGFSRSLDLASRGRPDATPVMRVRSRRPDFWRGQSFDRWDGRRWTISDERAVPLDPYGDRRPDGGSRGALDVPPPPEDRLVGFLGRPLVQTFEIQAPGPNLVYGAYRADQVYLPVSGVVLGDGTIRTSAALGPGTVYSVVSRRPPVTPEILRGERSLGRVSADLAARPLPPAFMERYTQLPGPLPPAVADLARRVTADEPTTYDKIRALEAWMGANTTYTLDIPPLPPGADPVEQFLFVDRQGYCEQIGTALVVMARSLGIPARLTVGFTPGEANPFTGTFQVRARDAHAWAEIYFPGLGWQAFDPTASVPLAGDAVGPSPAVSMVRFVADRLPGPPAWAAPVAGGLAASPLLAAALARAWLAARRRRGRSWAVAWLARLDSVGARRWRSRLPAESHSSYARALAEATQVGAGLPEAVAALQGDLFGPDPLDHAAREALEAELKAALARP